MSNYFYIIHEREFVRSGEQTFKIGKTGQNPPWKRLSAYPKDSELILLIKVPNKDIFENKIISIFKKKYRQMLEYGNEYFRGDIDEMVKDVHNLTSQPRKPFGIYKWFIDYGEDNYTGSLLILNFSRAFKNYSKIEKGAEQYTFEPVNFMKEVKEKLKGRFTKSCGSSIIAFDSGKTNKILKDLFEQTPISISDSDSDSIPYYISESDSIFYSEDDL